MAHHRCVWLALILWLSGILTACMGAPLPAPKPAALTVQATPTRLPALAATGSPQSRADAPSAIPDAISLAARVLEREHIPILCYHHVHDWTANDPVVDRPYIVPTARFAAQMEFLDTHGYHSITPDQLIAYLTTGAPILDKSVLLTFDDGDADQWTNALPILERHHFTATFFIMTIVLDKRFYLSRVQLGALDALGMTIGAHTWDHHRVIDYTDADWARQLTAATQELANLVGHPIRYFAYPYGLWNSAAIVRIKQAGFTAAFQLEARPDPGEPLFTIPRVIGSGYWKPSNLEHALLTRF